MNENEILEQKSVDQQLNKQTKTENKLILKSNCALGDKIQDFVNDSKNLLENSIVNINQNNVVHIKEVKSSLIVLENQKIEEHDNNLMNIDKNINNLQIDTRNNIITEELHTNKPDNEINSINKCQETITENIENQENLQLVYDWTTPKLISSAIEEFKPTEICENFTKGCYWSPDGTCILVSCEDFRLRIFELSQELYNGKLPKDFYIDSFKSALRVKEGGTIYDTCWFPYMNSWNPATCCFLSTSQGTPIHLWDAFTGQLRATYRAYNQVDEVEAAISIQFTDSGTQIWSGFKNALRIFETDHPGRQINTIYLKKDFPNVTGLVSCIRENPAMLGLIAFGTYSKCIGLYKDGPLCSFQTTSGVTQIEFSPCGTKLYSTVRRGSEFLCWDLRNPGTVLYSLQNRQSNTNQRIHFCLSYNGEEIISGGTDGAVRVWRIPNDLQIDEELNPSYKIQISKDCINGVSLHKNLPILAVSTGTRICDEEENKYRDNSLRFYWLGNR